MLPAIPLQSPRIPSVRNHRQGEREKERERDREREGERERELDHLVQIQLLGQT